MIGCLIFYALYVEITNCCEDPFVNLQVTFLMDFVYFLRILIVEKSIVNSRDKPCIYQVVRIVEWGITMRERERERAVMGQVNS